MPRMASGLRRRRAAPARRRDNPPAARSRARWRRGGAAARPPRAGSPTPPPSIAAGTATDRRSAAAPDGIAAPAFAARGRTRRSCRRGGGSRCRRSARPGHGTERIACAAGSRPRPPVPVLPRAPGPVLRPDQAPALLVLPSHDDPPRSLIFDRARRRLAVHAVEDLLDRGHVATERAGDELVDDQRQGRRGLSVVTFGVAPQRGADRRAHRLAGIAAIRRRLVVGHGHLQLLVDLVADGSVADGSDVSGTARYG